MIAASLFNHAAHHHHHLAHVSGSGGEAGSGSTSGDSQASPTESQRSDASATSADAATSKSSAPGTSEGVSDLSAEPSPVGNGHGGWTSDRDSLGPATPPALDGATSRRGSCAAAVPVDEDSQGAKVKAEEGTPVICPECGMLLADYGQFRKHRLEAHSTDKSLKDSSLSEDSKSAKIDQKSSTSDTPAHKCSECSAMFPNEMVLKYHIYESHLNGLSNASTAERVYKELLNGSGHSLPAYAAEGDHYAGDLSSAAGMFKCTFCGVLCANEAMFRSHLQDHHASDSTALTGLLSMAGAQQAQSAKLPTTTAFDGAFGLGGTNISPLSIAGPTPTTNGFASHISPTASEGRAAGANKIFNADAYCELCNKEFCNKYFLKTHKANKHGISNGDDSLLSVSSYPYSAANSATLSISKTSPTMVPAQDIYAKLLKSQYEAAVREEALAEAELRATALAGLSSDLALSALQLPPGAGQAPNPADGGLLDQDDQPQNLSIRSSQQQSLGQTHSPSLGGFGSIDSATALTALYNQLQQQQLRPNSETSSTGTNDHVSPPLNHGFPPSTPLAAAAQQLYNSVNGPAMPKPTFPELYCPLCRQSFPNQYVLQAHFMTIHGGGFNPMNIQAQAFYANMMGLGGPMAPNPAALFQASLLAERMKILAASSAAANQPPTSTFGGANLFGVKSSGIPATTPTATSAVGHNQEKRRSLVSPSVSESSYQQSQPAAKRPTTLGQDQPALNSTSSSVTKSTPSMTPTNQNGSTGNKEAFCDICKKEVCNKYFLKTHKLNKHGIAIDEPSPGRNAAGRNVSGNSTTASNQNNSSNCQVTSPRSTASDEGVSAYGISTFASMSNNNNGHTNSMSESNNAYNGPNVNALLNEVLSRPSTFQPNNSSAASIADGNIPSDLLMKYNPYGFTAENANPQAGSRTPPNEPPASHQRTKDAAKRSLSAAGAMDSTPPMKAPKLEPAYSPPPTTESLPYGGSDSRRGSSDAASVVSNASHSTAGSSTSTNVCTICYKSFSNTFAMLSHKLQEHPGSFDCGPSGGSKPTTSSADLLATFGKHKPSSSTIAIDPDAYCEVCKKEFCSKYFLRTHKLNIHGIVMDISPQGESGGGGDGSTTPDNRQQTPKVDALGRPMMTTGKNFCDVCNKELCNKYFLRTHMLKMHGVFIDENKTVIGNISMVDREKLLGLMGYKCDICHKELSSKHFLKIHRLNSHNIGSGSDGKTTPQANAGPPNVTVTPSMSVSPPSTTPKSEFADGKNAEMKTDLDEVEHRYFSNYTEVCPLCDRRFKSSKWLRTHMWNEHKAIPEMFPSTKTSFTNGVESDQDSVCGGDASSNNQIIDGRKRGSESDSNLSRQASLDSSTNGAAGDIEPSSRAIASACDYCGEVFRAFSDLQMHCITQHSDEVNGDAVALAQKAAMDTVNASVASFMMTSQGADRSAAGSVSSLDAQKPEPVARQPGHEVGERDICVDDDDNDYPVDESDSDGQLNESMDDCQTCCSGSPRKHRTTGKGSSKVHHCSFCNYRTRWLSNLYVHERRHTGEGSSDDLRQYVCQVCLKAYRYQHSLNRHMECHRYGALNYLQLQQIKQQQQPPADVPSTADASVCSPTTPSALVSQRPAATTPEKNPPSASAPSASISQTASAVKPHRCSKCQKLFTNRDLCRMHIIVAHNSPQATAASRQLAAASGPKSPPAAPIADSPRKFYRCKLCGHGSRVYDELRTHLTTTHNITAKQRKPAVVPEGNKAESSQQQKPAPQAPLQQEEQQIKSPKPTPIFRPKPIMPPKVSPSKLASIAFGASPRGGASGLNGCHKDAMAAGFSPCIPVLNGQQPYVMQPFVMEEVSKSGLFLSSMVYLPVSQNLAEPVEASFRFVPMKPPGGGPGNQF